MAGPAYYSRGPGGNPTSVFLALRAPLRYLGEGGRWWMRDVARAIHGAVLAGELGRRLEQDCEISDLASGDDGGVFSVRVGGEIYAVKVEPLGDGRGALH